MRKRLTRPVLVGALAVIVSEIVAGPAFGRVLIRNDWQTQGAAPSQHVQQSTFVSGYTDFPNVLRLHNTLTPTERRQLDAAVAASSGVSSSGSDFSWSDAGLGIGIGLAIAGGLVVVAVVGVRRSRATPVPA